MTIIEIPLPELARALRIGASIYSKNAVAVLNNMRLSVEKGRATLHFTSGDMWLTTSIPATADSITATTIPAELFAKATGSMDGDKLAIEANAARVTLKGGRAKFNLPTLPVDGFPLVAPDVEPEEHCVANAGELANAINAVTYAAPADGVMHVQCVRFDAEAGDIDLVTFDGKRMALDGVANAGASAAPFNLPLKAAQALAKLCAEAPKGDVHFFATDRLATFTCGDWTLTSKLCDDRFPNFAAALDERSKTPVSFDPRAMDKALARLALMADAKADTVDFVVSRDMVSISLTNQRTGEAAEEVPAFYDGPEMRIVYKLPYLRDALRQIAGDTAEMHLNPFEDALGRQIVRTILDPVNTNMSTSIHSFASYAQ